MIKAQIDPTASLASTDKNPVNKSPEQWLVEQYNIARILAEADSISKATKQVLQIICETGGWEFAALWRVEPGSEELSNVDVWNAVYPGLSEYAEAIQYSVIPGQEKSLLAHVLHSAELLWLPNFDDFPSGDAIDIKKAGLKSGFILPVRSNGKVIAMIECFSRGYQTKDRNLVDMLYAVSYQIGIFLERKAVEEKLVIQAEQQRLLAQVGIALSASLDFHERLQNFLRVIVPDLADWCAIDMIDPNNILQRTAAAHTDPDKLNLVYAMQPELMINFSQENHAVQTLLSGQSLLYTELTGSFIEEAVPKSSKIDLIRQLDPRSCIIVPLMAHDRILGTCTFVQADSGRSYAPNDLVLAEDIGRRLALALDNAILYEKSHQINLELEQRVDERTAQLQAAIKELTNQNNERKNAEEQVRILNAELEQRISERTSQLEVINRKLHREVTKHKKVSRDLHILLNRTQELYRISQAIGTVRLPNEVLSVLLSSSYLKNASRASIAILDRPWLEKGPPPEHCSILAEWNRGADRPKYPNHQFTLQEYGIVLPVPYAQPIVIAEIQSIQELPRRVRSRFSSLGTKSLIILPLIANGEWYGLLSLHYSTRRMLDMDDLRHIRGLVDETAIAIKNVCLLDAESQARHEAEIANELKLKFLAMISHELRTPLASIKGFATTLLSEDVVWPVDKQHDFLQTIDSEADNLSDLIEQLLDLSRIEAGVLRILPKKYLFQEIVATALPQIHAVTTQHKLVIDIPPDLPPIYGDEQRIAQVLTNLVGNAAKYSPEQTQIMVSIYPKGDMVQIDVSDQGTGIPPHERANIFRAFHQLDNETRAHMKGAGLGLAICKGLIEAQGGAIWIQDRPGPGTVVSFTLPVRDMREEPVEG